MSANKQANTRLSGARLVFGATGCSSKTAYATRHRRQIAPGVAKCCLALSASA